MPKYKPRNQNYEPISPDNGNNIKTLGKNKNLTISVRLFKDDKINQNYWHASCDDEIGLNSNINSRQRYAFR